MNVGLKKVIYVKQSVRTPMFFLIDSIALSCAHMLVL